MRSKGKAHRVAPEQRDDPRQQREHAARRVHAGCHGAPPPARRATAAACDSWRCRYAFLSHAFAPNPFTMSTELKRLGFVPKFSAAGLEAVTGSRTCVPARRFSRISLQTSAGQICPLRRAAR